MVIEDRDEVTNQIDEFKKKYKMIRVERDALKNEA